MVVMMFARFPLSLRDVEDLFMNAVLKPDAAAQSGVEFPEKTMKQMASWDAGYR